MTNKLSIVAIGVAIISVVYAVWSRDQARRELLEYDKVSALVGASTRATVAMRTLGVLKVGDTAKVSALLNLQLILSLGITGDILELPASPALHNLACKEASKIRQSAEREHAIDEMTASDKTHYEESIRRIDASCHTAAAE